MNDSKEYIIDQAFELFLTKSYEAVSIIWVRDKSWGVKEKNKKFAIIK